MRARGILETVLYGRDIAALDRFYSDILGLERHFVRQGAMAMFRCGDQMLLIFNPEVTEIQKLDAAIPIPAHGARGPGHVCFRASRAEIAQWRQHLESHGIEIESQFDWPSGGRSLYFRDPAGNSVEFAEPGIWGLGE